MWPVGLLTSLFYIVIFYQTKFYADMGLQVYYVVISAYGLYNWMYGKKGQSTGKLYISKIRLRQLIVLAPIAVVLFAGLSYILIHYTDSPVPYGDSFTTAISIIATWMLARKILEQWLLWIVANAVSLALYSYKGMYPTTILFVFYTGLSVVGYIQWRKSYRNQET